MAEEVIPILHVRNAAPAAAWYQRLGFAQEWEHRFEPGFPAGLRVFVGICGLTVAIRLGIGTD
jgi:hypothetical protein